MPVKIVIECDTDSAFLLCESQNIQAFCAVKTSVDHTNRVPTVRGYSRKSPSRPG